MIVNSPYTRIGQSSYLRSIEWAQADGKNYSSPRHFHEELEVNIRQGDGWRFNYRGTRHSVPPNTLVLTQPGEAHQTDCTSDCDCLFRGVRVSADLLQQVAIEVAGRETAIPCFPIPLVHDRTFSTQFIQVHQALQYPSSQLEKQTLIQDLLVKLILHYAESPLSLVNLGTEIQPVDRIRSYLEDHYNQEISLEQLSQVANLSSFHLNRSFRKTFGMPPHAYQIQLRILQAKRLLRKGRSIDRVAIETGFVSQSHFGSHFKRLIGVTPRQYIQYQK
jgi:AraC-like DNA-binding protein